MTLKEIGNEILAQDNRSTSHPVFQVMDGMETREGVTNTNVIQSFFTQIGADEYIEDNRHNMNDPYTYIASGFNNPEWIQIRAHLVALTKGEI